MLLSHLGAGCVLVHLDSSQKQLLWREDMIQAPTPVSIPRFVAPALAVALQPVGTRFLKLTGDARGSPGKRVCLQPRLRYKKFFNPSQHTPKRGTSLGNGSHNH